MSANLPGSSLPLLGLISKIFRSIIIFSMASSKEGSPGSAQGSTSI